MKIYIRFIQITLALVVAAVSFANSAEAGCGFPAPKLKSSAWNSSSQTAPRFQSAVYRPDPQGQFMFTSDNDNERWRDDGGIVGMWRFELVAPGPAGSSVVVDVGYAQWHSDGTEIQNSGLHAPITSNFCLGVWKQVGRNAYKLAHFPLGWDSAGQNPANAIQLNETVELQDENHMTGTFTLKVYSWATVDSLNVAGPPVATIKGTLSATRVSVDSSVPGAQ